MELFIQGLAIGLAVTAMVGPITLTILDSSLSKGWRMGVLTASAMWMSDVLYIIASFYAVKFLLSLSSGRKTDFSLDVVAGCIFITIGIILWKMRQPRKIKTKIRLRESAGYFVRGFLVNTFSPFTIVFWPTITMSMVSDEQLSGARAVWLFGGILFSIISGDTLKSVFAAWIRSHISDRWTRYVKVVIAVCFICIGLFVLGRASYFFFLAS